MGIVHRPRVSGRLHLFRQDDLIDPAAHELVALACRRFEPRPVNLDRTPSIGSDRARSAKLGNDMRHRRPPHAEEFRKRLLGQRQHVTISPIVDVQQPPRQTRLDRVQRIAGRDVLELRHQCPGESLNRSVQGAAAAERRLKSCWRNLQCGPCHPHHRRHRRAGRPQRCQDARGSLIADNGGRDRLAVRHIHDEGDQAAEGKIDPLDFDPPTAPARRPVQAQPVGNAAQANRGLLAATQLTVDYQLWSCAPSREYSFPDGGAARCSMARQTACG